MEWLNRYEMRPITGALPRAWDGSGDHSLTQLWMRDAPARPLDFARWSALADLFFPVSGCVCAFRVPAGTVSITVLPCQRLTGANRHRLPAGPGAGRSFATGFDQTVQLWNEAGTMLATSHQIVYYKH